MILLLHSERQAIHLARKKIVFIIVEGPSDDEALGVLFHRIFDRNTVFVHVFHGDITTERGVTSGRILNRVGNEIRSYAKSNHFTSRDFQEIIHIVDMDGAYIPDGCVTENDSAVSLVYSDAGIETRTPSAVIARNRQKRQNLDKLCASDQVWNVPYRIFYMSCNLDHVLYNKRNSSDAEKENHSYAFARRYRDDIEGFQKFITSSDFSVVMGYRESWEFIKEGTESLKRHTNLGLCFPAGAPFS